MNKEVIRHQFVIPLVGLLILVLTSACGNSARDEQIAIALTQTAAVVATEAAVVPSETPIPPSATPPAPLETPTPPAGAETETIADADSGPAGSLPAALFYIGGQSKQVERLDPVSLTSTTVTAADGPVTDFTVAPDGAKLAYVSNNALYELNLDDGQALLKFQGEDLRADDLEQRVVRELRAPRYSPDGQQIAFGLNGVNLIPSGSSTDAQVLLESSPYPDPATPPAGSGPIRFFWPASWSPDGATLLVEFAYFPEAGGLTLLDMADGTLTEVTGQEDTTVICCEAAWQSDSASLYLASNFLAYGTPGVAVVDTATGLTANLVGGLPSDPNATGPFRFFRAPFWHEGQLLVMMNEVADLSQSNNEYLPVTVAGNGIVSALGSTTADLTGQVAWAPGGSGLAYTLVAPGNDPRNPAPFYWFEIGRTPAPLGISGMRPVWGPPEADDADQAPVADMDATAEEVAAYAADLWSIAPDDDAAGISGVFAFSLAPAAGTQLWVAHTVGMRGFAPEQYHTIGVFMPDGAGWQEMARMELGREVDLDDPDPVPDYLSEGGVFQVEVEPTHLWLQVEGGVGAHSGTFNLLSFDGETLQTEAGGFSSSPGVGEIADINGDGIGEVLVDATDYYVFCYACGVRRVEYTVWRWTGDGFERVELRTLPADAPDALRTANDRAVELAEAGLWKDALALMLEALESGENHPDFDWNLRVIQFNAGAKRAEALNTETGYDLLDNIFYGDYDAAVDVMRAIPIDRLFSDDSPLVVGTPAEGSVEILADWIERTSTEALAAMPDLAAAYYLRGWAAYLLTQDPNQAFAHVAQAAALDHDDLFYQDTLGYLAGDPVPVRPTPDAAVTSTVTPEPDDEPTATATAVSTPIPTADADDDTVATGDAETGDVETADDETGDDETADDEIERDTELAADPASAVVTAAQGRLYFSAQNSDGQTAVFQWNDDGSVTEIVVDAAQPAIQPGGDRLAFQSLRDDMLGLGGYDLTRQERVRFSFNVEDSMPTWDPGPQQILFSSTRYGDGNSRLYQVWADGRGEAIDLGFGQDPDWHPTEARIVFRGCDERGDRCGLWTMAPDGSNRTPLTDNPGDARPDWTPNGRFVVFMSNERDGNWELYRVDVDSGAVLRLTDNPANDGLPAVSPDGTEVAFMNNRDGVWSIQVVPIDGGVSRTLHPIGENVADWLNQGIEWER